MQAMAVLLLEMFYRGTHMTKHGNKQIPKSIKKLLHWLRAMRTQNLVAGRAYKLVVDILKSGESRVQGNIADLLPEDEVDIDRGYLMSDYHGDGDAALPTNTFTSMPMTTGDGEENVFAPGNWQQGNWQQWIGDQFETGMSDPFFLPEPVQMQFTYGNPFMTNFDQQNPISMSTGMEELWSGTGGASEEFSPD